MYSYHSKVVYYISKLNAFFVCFPFQEGVIKVWEYIGFTWVNLIWPSEGGNICTLLPSLC